MKHTLQSLLREYEWIHNAINILGNIAFLVGSVFFLWEGLMIAGTWLFILGALGMTIGSIGDAIVKFEWRGGQIQSAANYSPHPAAREKSQRANTSITTFESDR